MSERTVPTTTEPEPISNAARYADSLIEGIRENAEAGAPFGYGSSRDDMGTYDTREELIEQSGIDPDDVTEASAMDYLSDALDIHYIVNSDRTYRAARVCIALGGPTAWLDTRTGELEVTWWSAPERRELPKAFVDGLDNALSELWEMGA